VGVLKKYLLLAVFCLLITISALLYFGIIWFNNPSLKEYPVQGLDVSHHQGKIDWSEVKKSRFKFVLIKATEGTDFKDHLFKINLDSAVANGFLAGAYHYYTLAGDSEKQAKNFIETVPVSIGLPPVVDLEYGGNSSRRPAKEDFTREVKVFLELLERHYGVKPVLYVTYEFYDQYIWGELKGYPVWIRDVFKKPGIKGVNWHFWQYNCRGRVKGIKTYVDLNVFNGDMVELKKILRPQMKNADKRSAHEPNNP
jgi:lysozyme